MKSVLQAVVVGLAVSALSAGAYAADAGKDKESKGAAGSSAAGSSWPTFKKADNDGNGAISMDEARSVGGLAANFAQYDKNSDGKLSRSEYESAKKGAGKASGAGTNSASGSSGSSSKSESKR